MGLTPFVESTGNYARPDQTTPYRTLWDIDFTKVAPGNWSADGTILTRNGKDMTARNRTSFATAMGINATDGLFITTIAGAAVYGAGPSEMTAPYIQVQFPELNFNVGPIRTRVAYDARGALNDFNFLYTSWQWAGFGMWNALLVGNNSAVSPTTRVHLGSMVGTNTTGGVRNTTNIPETGLGSSDMRMTDFDMWDGRFSSSLPDAGGAWPNFPALPELWFEAIDRKQVRSGSDLIIKDPSASSSPAPIELNLVAQSTGVAWTAKVRRVQVDQYIVFNP